MAAPVICPRCQQVWTPTSRQAAASVVCPACRRVPSPGARVPEPSTPGQAKAWPVVVPLVLLGIAIAGALPLAAGWRLLAHRPALGGEVVQITHILAETESPQGQARDELPVEQPAATMEREWIPAPQRIASEPAQPVDMKQPAVAPAEPKPLPFKRIRPSPSADQLIRQLMTVKEVELENLPGVSAKRSMIEHAQANKHAVLHPTPPVLSRRADLVGLPLQMGADCHLGKESAKTLEVLSRKLRTYLSEAANAKGGRAGAAIDDRVNVEQLHEKLIEDGNTVWGVPEAVPTLVQLLQAEDKPVRLLLVKLLAKINCPEATLALARRACFDVSAGVREEAVRALQKRPDDEFVDYLLQTLRYPWPAAADFAAEALVNLNQSAALPALVRILDEPDPSLPTTSKVSGAEVKVVREMVRVNHLKNCMLCHAPALETTDLVRGLIPDQNKPLPPTFSPAYYGGNSLGGFVRADVTYLRQDFSVPQEVANHGVWPSHQRYDYMVRTRLLPAAERIFREPKKGPVYPQREAVLFALRELTGEDHGADSDAWNEALIRGVNARK